MAPLVIRDSDDDDSDSPRTTKKTRVSAHESSELSELTMSSAISKRDSPKVTKIITRDDASDDEEPTYTCIAEGSRKKVKLKESQLEKKMVSTFKKASETVTIEDSDDDHTESGNARSESKSDTNFISDDSDEGGKRKRRSGNRRATRASGRNTRDNDNGNRRSTRDTRRRGSLKLKDPISEELRESESDELDIVKVHSTRAQRKSDRDQRKSDQVESEDLTERGSSQPRTHKPKSPRKIKTKLRVGDRPRDEHHESCAKCSGPFEPDLVKNWKKANQHRSRKITTRSLLHKFPTLDDVYDQGCWIDCSDCSMGYHYGCLPFDMRKDIARQHKQEREALLLKEQDEPADQHQDTPSDGEPVPAMKKEQLPHIRLSIKCPMCIKPHGGECMICGNGLKSALTTVGKGSSSPAATASAQVKVADKEEKGPQTNVKKPQLSKTNDSDVDELELDTSKDQPIFFRCTSCRRPAHYLCLPTSDEETEDDIDRIAEYWQSDWTCKDCNQLEELSVQYILAWRKPMSLNSSQDHKKSTKANDQLVGTLHSPSKGRKVEKAARTQLPDVKDPFDQAEYLCKFEDFSFTDCAWVPHSYMAAKHTSKLRNFLSKGPQLDLKQLNGLADEAEEEDSGGENKDESLFNLEPDRDAESKIPKAWLTPERILSVEFANEKLIDDVKEKDIPTTAEVMYDSIERAYIKWEEQAYVSSTWSDKTPKDSPYFPAFMAALDHYVKFRKFVVPVVKHEKELARLDAPRPRSSFVAFEEQPDYIPHELMGFQRDGVNFCYYNWHSQHPTILADEMGLGKTVQICSLIAVLTKIEKRMPFLIVVPNSTIGNWVRECAKWLPDLKCVPLPGAADSCEIVEQWELFKTLPKSKPQLSAHVVLATYQAAEKNAAVLAKVQRWEAVIVDEGQRLKAGPKGGLFKALHSMRTGHRILMSGTPLNNNLRELFNLLSFLNPEEYPLDVIDDCEKRYENLTPELVEELRNIIRPYMLRRTKETALDLPKLTEIIVPISMRPLQKKVYKGLLSKNVAVITAIYSKKKTKHSKASCMNLLMQLRKALAHPYLNDPEIEPEASDEQTHDNLVEASGKLVFLQTFIPKLLKRGHRILIFSQFTIFLDIMERFLEGEERPYLRLDGTTSQLDRQTRIDAFNRPNSNHNIFLLSTRAGGAGINLATADTVIILDPDYNPHNDLQAISRAHRFGQKKPVNVFKLMTSASAEERIVQTGKKKLVLDHLVIQKVSEEETEAHDVESILQYGAKELLTASEEALQQDIRYTDAELDELIQRTTEEAKTCETADPAKKADITFAYARVWEKGSRGLTSLDKVGDVEVNENVQEQRSFWDSVLQANQEEEQSSAANNETETGRGYRKRRDVAYTIADLDPSPKKRKTGPSKDDDDDDDMKGDGDFQLPEEIVDSSDDELGGQPPDDEDITAMLNGTVPADPMAIAAKKAASDERRRQKLADRYSRMAQGPVDWPAHQMTNQQLPQANPVQYLPNSCTHPQVINSASIAAGQSSRPVVPKPKHPQVANINMPKLDGLNPAASKRAMDMILRDIQQKARALSDPALDQLLDSMRGQPSSRQKEIMSEAAVLVKKLTRRKARQAKAAREAVAMDHQVYQPATPMQHSTIHGPPVHPPHLQQQAMRPTLQQHRYSPMYATQPHQSTSAGSQHLPESLPPPRFKETNPKSIKPYLQNLQTSTNQPWPSMGPSQAQATSMEHRNSMGSTTSSSKTKSSRQKSRNEKSPVAQPSGQSSNGQSNKGPQDWGTWQS